MIWDLINEQRERRQHERFMRALRAFHAAIYHGDLDEASAELANIRADGPFDAFDSCRKYLELKQEDVQSCTQR